MKEIQYRHRRAALRRAALAVACFASFCLLPATSSAAPPSIEAESVSNVTTSSATLEAKINPGNLEGGAYYQFQIAVNPASEYWPEVTCPENSSEVEVPCLGPYGTVDGPPPMAAIDRRPGDLPTVRISGGSEGVAVSLDLAQAGVVLQPETTYHYRVLAVESPQTVDSIVWEAPPTYGADQTFVTPGAEKAGEPPVTADPAPLTLGSPLPVAPIGPVATGRKRKCQRAPKAGVRQRVQGNYKAGHPNRRCRRPAKRS